MSELALSTRDTGDEIIVLSKQDVFSCLRKSYSEWNEKHH